MPGIFISYRRSDSQSAAGRLTDSLGEHLPDASVFRDVETIDAGADFIDAITASLKSCQVLLAVIGPRWSDITDAQGRRRLDDPGDLTRLELATALNRTDVRVIPVLVDGAIMPSMEVLPDDLKALARRNAIELTDRRWNYDVSQLAVTLRRHLGLPHRSSTRRKSPVVWVAAALLLSAIAGVLFMRGPEQSAVVSTIPASTGDAAGGAVRPGSGESTPSSAGNGAAPAGPVAPVTSRNPGSAPGSAETEPCPARITSYGATLARLTCTCSAEATQGSSVWGTDVYTEDSSLCRAAVHAGVITVAGGSVTVERAPGRALYIGTTRRGVQSSDYSRYGSSIRFAGAPLPPGGPEFCPSRFSTNREITTLTCVCSVDAARSGSVWGTDVYTDDSMICAAAVHAGALTTAGGVVTVERVEGRPRYPGSPRNGISSSDYGPYASSMRFVRK